MTNWETLMNDDPRAMRPAILLGYMSLLQSDMLRRR